MSTHPDPLGDTPERTPSSTSTQHPDRDALADFSAGVLTDGDAAAVRTHVDSCGHCEESLAEIESVRELLLADDPGPMPDDVWARIASALEVEASASTGAGSPAPVASIPEPTSGPDEPAAPLGGVTVLRRPTPSGGTGHRRRVTGFLPTLGMAAGVAALLGGLVVAVQQWMPGADSDSGATADLSLAEGADARAFAGMVRTSGTDYRRASIDDQVRLLVTGRVSTTTSATTGREPAPAADGKRPEATERDQELHQDRNWSSAYATATAEQAGALRDPAVLRQCLAGLGLAGSEPVAVDLAKFEGRDAAVLVLEAADGASYEVYAVSRLCGTSEADDGAFTYVRVAR